MATRVLLTLLTVTSPGRPVVYEKYKVLWSTLLQPERPPEPTLDVSRSMLGAKVAILKSTHVLYVASKETMQRSTQSKSQGGCYVGK